MSLETELAESNEKFLKAVKIAQSILDGIGPFGEYYESYQRQLDELCPEKKPTNYLRFYEAKEG